MGKSKDDKYTSMGMVDILLNPEAVADRINFVRRKKQQRTNGRRRLPQTETSQQLPHSPLLPPPTTELQSLAPPADQVSWALVSAGIFVAGALVGYLAHKVFRMWKAPRRDEPTQD